MPPEVEDCVESVLEDNPEYSKSRAYAICNAQKNKGNLSVGDNPTHDELLKALSEHDGECLQGKVKAGETCVDVEEVGVNVTSLSAPRILSTRKLAGPIKRTEMGEDKVKFESLALLDEGVWTDAGSGEPTHYDPAELEIAAGNTVNIAHDSESESSEAGYIDPDSWHVENGTGFADVVLETDTAAGQYADENLQEALESNGRKGLGGPSIELPKGTYDIEENGELGYPKVVNGEIHGMALVKEPASKSTSFAHQTSNRGVALSDGSQNPMVFTQEDRNMADAETYREVLESNGVDTGDMTDDEIMAIYEDLMEESETGDGDAEPEMEEGEDDPEEEPEEPEGDDTDMADDGAVEAIQEQIDDLWDAMDEMKNQMADSEELSEGLESAREELADAETVNELQGAKEELDKRLSELEEEPKNPRSLADGAEGEEDPEPDGPVSFGHNYDEKSGTISR